MIDAALLIYTYVPDMETRRVPYREAHLALLRQLHAAGDCLFGGAFGDPVSGGAIAFRSVDVAETFVADDPFGAAGLVTAARIEPWKVPIGLD